MDTIKSSLKESYQSRLSELLAPLSITEISELRNLLESLPFESLTGQTVIRSSSGTRYYMKWSTSTYGSLEHLIGMGMETDFNTLLDELE